MNIFLKFANICFYCDFFWNFWIFFELAKMFSMKKDFFGNFFKSWTFFVWWNFFCIAIFFQIMIFNQQRFLVDDFFCNSRSSFDFCEQFWICEHLSKSWFFLFVIFFGNHEHVLQYQEFFWIQKHFFELMNIIQIQEYFLKLVNNFFADIFSNWQTFFK